MSVITVTPPYVVFPDADGESLEGGMIYVGTANQNPLIPVNQLALYSDSSLTIPVAQPVRTTGGYAINSGSPIQIYAGVADYSIVILDRNGSLIFSSPSNKTKLGLIDLATDVTGFLISTSIKYDITPAEIAAGCVIVNTYLLPGNVLRYGTNTVPNTTDMTIAVQAAHNQGMQATGARPYAPAGTYLITTTITPCQLGIYGDGAKNSVISCNNVHTFTIPAAADWKRSAVVFEKFGIRSNDGVSCDTKWAFYAPGVAGGAAPLYNSGFTVRDVSIGLNGTTTRMGGGFYLKDLAGPTISNIWLTDVARAFQVVGSVLQSSFSDVHAFLGDAGAGVGPGGGSVGFSTESANYSTGTLTPEHLTTRDVSLIVFDTGLSHSSGLDCNFYNTDIQARVLGISVGAQANIKGAIVIPHSSNVLSWTGVTLGVSPGPKEGRFLSNIDISVFNSPGTPATSYGFDMGDGVSPVYGVVLRECTVKGNANSLQSLIRGRIHKDLTIENCILEAAVALGTEVNLSSVQRLFLNFNQCAGGIFAVGDGGDATANGVIVGNQITTLTLSPLTSPKNWTTGQNDGLTPVRHAWEQGTVTLTLTGCTTAPTIDATWLKNGLQTLINIPTLTAVSNTVACSLTGLPASLQPNVQQDVIGRGTDNGGNSVCGYRFSPGSGTIGMFFGITLGAWTAAGTKGVNNTTVPYSQA
jgi:hypothetical protein